MTDSGRLGRLGGLFADAVLLIEWPGGRIVDANRKARRLLDLDLANGDGTLFDKSPSNSEALNTYLRACAGTGDALPGRLAFRVEGEDCDFGVTGCTIEPRSGRGPTVVGLRISQPEFDRFSLLNEKIGELSDEVTLRARVEAFLDDMRIAFELITQGAPLEPVLEHIARGVERYSVTGIVAAISLLDLEGKRLIKGGAPNLPDEYNEAINGLEIGADVGSCGTAAFLNETIVVRDIASDPRWKDHAHLALAHGLRACWSTPIPSLTHTVLGTLALYYRSPREPLPDEERIVAIASRTAAVAIELQRGTDKMNRLLERERRAREEAEGANLAKDEFLAVVSHELRNPLSAILGWARLLQEGDLDEESRRRGLASIERNAENQTQLISDVLDFSRVATGSLRLAPETLLVSSLVGRAIDSLLPVAQSQGVLLRFETLGTERPVLCDRERIYQVLYNLITNAIKFTQSGGRIDVTLQEKDGFIHLSVRDDGEGIPEEFVPYVFDRFRQADSSRSRTHPGLGLGLAVVKSLIELHGGSVSAESEGIGRGSTFTVALPLADLPTTGRPNDEREVAGESLAGVRVLVVDDQPDAVDLFSTILRRAGAVVRTAQSGVEAIALLNEEVPDVLVSDIAMPDMDGLDLLKRIRETDPTMSQLPAVALSAHARDRDRDGALATGYDLHLAKPVEPGKLVRAVQSLASSRPSLGTGM